MSPFKDTVLGYLRAIANAESETIYQNSVDSLKTSDMWKMSPKNFKDWILFTWIAVHKKWVKCYRLGLMEITVNTNNGVGRKNRDLYSQNKKSALEKRENRIFINF